MNAIDHEELNTCVKECPYISSPSYPLMCLGTSVAVSTHGPVCSFTSSDVLCHVLVRPVVIASKKRGVGCWGDLKSGGG